MPGEHVICLYSNSTKWFSGTQLRVHLDIQVGEHAIDYANVAQKEKLSELQLRVRQLLDQVIQALLIYLRRIINTIFRLNKSQKNKIIKDTEKRDLDKPVRAQTREFYGNT